MKNVKYAKYTELSPVRDVTAAAFPGGQINFQIQNASMTRWNPFRSYLRMRITLSQVGGAQFNHIDDIGPAMFQGHCFWQQLNIQCNGVKVSEMDDYIPQISALRKRYAIGEGRRTGMLGDTNFAQADLTTRINQISADGEDSKANLYRIIRPIDNNATISMALQSPALNLAAFNGRPNTTAFLSSPLEAVDTIAIAVGGAGAVSVATWVDTNAVAPGLDIRALYRIGDVVSCHIVGAVPPPNHNSTFTIVAFVGPLVAQVISSTGEATGAQPVGAGHHVIRHSVSANDTAIVTGVNTTFLSNLQVGDLIVEEGTNSEMRVVNVANDLQAHVVHLTATPFATTLDWHIKRKKQSRRVRHYELCFKPCLGLFSLDKWLPGNWKLELTPQSSAKYMKYAIESLNYTKTPGLDFTVIVEDLKMYVCKGAMTTPKNNTETFNFTEIRCQAQTITSATSLTKSFVVNKNAHTFSFAFQKPDSGDDTRYPKTKFTMLNGYEKNLSSYQLRLNGESLPVPVPDIRTNSGLAQDFSTQQYYEMLHYNGTIFLDEPESLTDWFERGPYYTYVLPKKPVGSANTLYVTTEFRDPRPENFLLMVFDHYHKSFQIEVENGLVVRCTRDKNVN